MVKNTIFCNLKKQVAHWNESPVLFYGLIISMRFFITSFLTTETKCDEHHTIGKYLIINK